MPPANKPDAAQAVLELFEALGQFLMTEVGIGVAGAREFAKIGFARAARRLTPPREDGSVNYTAIAGITGLTRQEVPALLEEQAGSQAWTLQRNQQRLQRIIDAWCGKYRTKGGSPAVLKIRGPRRSLECLCKLHGGSDRVETNLEMLLQAKAVETLSGERVRLLRRQFATARMDPATQAAFAAQIAECIQSACENAGRPPEDRLFATRIESAELDPDPNTLAMLKHNVAERGAAFGKAVDRELNDPLYRAKPGQTPRRLAVISYLVELKSVAAATPQLVASRRRRAKRPRSRED